MLLGTCVKHLLMASAKGPGAVGDSISCLGIGSNEISDSSLHQDKCFEGWKRKRRGPTWIRVFGKWRVHAASFGPQHLQVPADAVGRRDSPALLWEGQGDLGKDASWASRWETSLLLCQVSFPLLLIQLTLAESPVPGAALAPGTQV